MVALMPRIPLQDWTHVSEYDISIELERLPAVFSSSN